MDINRLPRNTWDQAPWNRWSFQHIEDFLMTTQVKAPDTALSLPSEHLALGEKKLSSIGNKKFDHFLEDSYTDGMLIFHRGSVVYERYLNNMNEATLHLSQSMSKSVVSAITGVLCQKGDFSTTAKLTDYLPELEETAYKGATIEHVLNMASGVKYDETYINEKSDIAITEYAAGWKPAPAGLDVPETVFDQIKSLKNLEAEHGSRWLYRSIETDVLGHCLERKTGIKLAELLSQHIWQPMGASHTARFTVDKSGYATADGGLTATLRDYARFGLLYLHEGKNLAGEQVIPRDWVNETRQGNHQHFAQTGSIGLPDGAYRNQFWIEDSTERALMCVGIFGQLIYIHPESEFLFVKLSSWPTALDPKLKIETIAAIHDIRLILMSNNLSK